MSGDLKLCPLGVIARAINPQGRFPIDCAGEMCEWWISERTVTHGITVNADSTTYIGGCALHALAVSALRKSMGGWPDDSH